MQHKISRRALVKSGLIAGTLVPALGLLGNTAGAQTSTPLDPSDPTASKVDATANPTYKAGQKCGTCAQFTGKAAATTGGCNIFVGHTVPSSGWCKVWAQKS
jgi:hypothetical protein